MEIRDFKHVGKGALKCKFDLYLPQLKMTIREIKVLCGKRGDFVSMPSREYTDPQGAKKYWDYISVDKEFRDAFNEAVLKLVEPYIKQATSATSVFSDDSCPF